MEFFNVLTVEEAHFIIENLAKDYLIETESIDLIDAVNRTVAADIIAPVNLPEFNRSTVDGYAVISSDVMGASESMPSFLQFIDEVSMGKKIDTIVNDGQAVYVPTGGMIPEGADGVVMIEYTEKLDDETILIYRPIAPGENITFIGDDLEKGKLVIKNGKKITPYDIGLLAGMGIRKIEVYNKPVFSILSTGDEIVDLHEEKQLGKVRDINGYALNALITNLGGQVNQQSIVKDEFDKLKSVLANMIEESDIVLISGGSSVGVRDYTKKLIESFDNGKVLVHGISVKPGKPTIIGRVNNKIIFGLPGHPASALMIFNIFVKFYFELILKRQKNQLVIEALITKNVHSSPGKETYQMVELIKDGDRWLAVPIYAKSGMVSLLSKSSGYIKITDEKEGLLKGDKVSVNLLQEVYI